MGMHDAAGFVIDTARLVMDGNAAHEEVLANQAAVRQDFDTIRLGDYHGDFNLASVIVQEAAGGRNTPKNWEAFSWVTAHTPMSIDALNNIAGLDPPITLEQLAQDPLMAYDNFREYILSGNRTAFRDATGDFRGDRELIPLPANEAPTIPPLPTPQNPSSPPSNTTSNSIPIPGTSQTEEVRTPQPTQRPSTSPSSGGNTISQESN